MFFIVNDLLDFVVSAAPDPDPKSDPHSASPSDKQSDKFCQGEFRKSREEDFGGAPHLRSTAYPPRVEKPYFISYPFTASSTSAYLDTPGRNFSRNFIGVNPNFV